MTEILDVGSADAETVAVAWLKTMRPNTDNHRDPGDPLPMTVVGGLPGTECIEESIADDLVGVYTLCDKAAGYAAARNEADKTHRRMLLLARYLDDVNIGGGRVVSVDYVDVFERPHWIKYADDQILCKVGRYRIGFSYT